MGSVFFHIDLDAFFASVEILDNPEYRGKPLIIGTPGPRHVASTCSYEARKYGVHSAMPMTEALRLCPNAICIPGRMHRYSEMSRRVMGIISSFAPGFLQVSVDEAFLDLTGMERIYPLPGKAARKLKDEIRKETGLTASIGVASSRFVAKLASDYRKPDGLTIVPRGKEEEFVSAVGLRKLWGIGDSMYQSLIRKGITSVEILRKYDENDLKHFFGESNGHYLYLVASTSSENRMDITCILSQEESIRESIRGKRNLDQYPQNAHSTPMSSVMMPWIHIYWKCHRK